MKINELNEILRKHLLWIDGDAKGEKANFRGC